MPGALEHGLALAALRKEHQALFYKNCAACGAKPREWCDQRLGSICAGRGSVFRLKNKAGGWLMPTVYSQEFKAREAMHNLPQGDYEIITEEYL